MKKTLLALTLVTLSATSHAAVVALFGSNSNSSIAAFLQSNGHSVVYQNSAAPSASALQGVDAVISMRNTDGNDAVKDFVLGGGLLITEWNAAKWAIDTAKLLDGKTNNNKSIGTGTTITQTDAAMVLGLGDNNLGKQYADGPRTEFVWEITEVGAGVDVLGTLPNGSPAIIGGKAGNGYVLANSLDWGDGFIGNSASGQWLLKALNIQYKHVPEPFVPALLGIGLTAFLFKKRRRHSGATHHTVA